MILFENPIEVIVNEFVTPVVVSPPDIFILNFFCSIANDFIIFSAIILFIVFFFKLADIK